MSTGQDPTHVVTHILGFLPQNNRFMCMVHDGKSIPWNASLGEPCGNGEALPVLSKKATPLEVVVRSGVRCAQCQLSANSAHKPHS